MHLKLVFYYEKGKDWYIDYINFSLDWKDALSMNKDPIIYLRIKYSITLCWNKLLPVFSIT